MENFKKSYVIYYTYIINMAGKKGVKIRRIEDAETGKEVNLKDFLSKHKISPSIFNADFIGIKGLNVQSAVLTKIIEI